MKGIIEFKNLFPKGKIQAGQAMLFRKSPDGSMSIELDVSNSASLAVSSLSFSLFAVPILCSLTPGHRQGVIVSETIN